MSSDSRITIVHLINGLGVGGAETMLVKLVSGMNPSSFSNVVVTLTDGGSLAERITDSGIPVRSLGMPRGRPTVSGFFRLLGILREIRPQVLQTWLYHADLMGLVASRLTRVPRLVWNIRVSNLDMDKYPRTSRWALGACARLSGWPDLVLVNSETAIEFHTELGYRPKAWRVIPNGFDTTRFRPDPAARRRFRDRLGRADAFLVGLVARYDPMKDHPTFLDAARLFRRMQPDAHFVLAGTGIDEGNATLVEAARARGLADAVTLIGERHDMHAVLPALDVLTLSSAFGEGFSNAIGEGMSCGVPPVVTEVGDMAAVVGPAGRIVAPRDPRSLTGAWNEIHEMGADGRSRLGFLARSRIEELYSLERIVDEYERTYRELVADPGGSLANSRVFADPKP